MRQYEIYVSVQYYTFLKINLLVEGHIQVYMY